MTKRNIIVAIVCAGMLALLVISGVQMHNRQQNIDAATAKINAGYVPAEQVLADKPVSLDGAWKAEGMTATIANSVIEVRWASEDMDALYWKGTFIPPEKLSVGTKINSLADTAAMEESMLASQDTTKDFTYEKDSITFKLTIRGLTQVIRLVR